MSGQSVYIIGTSRNGPVKVGISANPASRAREMQTACALPLKVFGEWPCHNAKLSETLMHRVLEPHRMSGEWFEVPVEMAMAAMLIASHDDGTEFTPDWQLDVWKAHLGFPGCDIDAARAAVPDGVDD